MILWLIKEIKEIKEKRTSNDVLEMKQINATKCFIKSGVIEKQLHLKCNFFHQQTR
tara:strand:- start:1242 stop:1409 length:168 start_codon:yes stop_codon:yes gene_type:complete